MATWTMLAAKLTWSSVLIVGDSPPWTQKIWLSMMADRLHQEHTQRSNTQTTIMTWFEGGDKGWLPSRKHAPAPPALPAANQDWQPSLEPQPQAPIRSRHPEVTCCTLIMLHYVPCVCVCAASAVPRMCIQQRGQPVNEPLLAAHCCRCSCLLSMQQPLQPLAVPCRRCSCCLVAFAGTSCTAHLR